MKIFQYTLTDIFKIKQKPSSEKRQNRFERKTFLIRQTNERTTDE